MFKGRILKVSLSKVDNLSLNKLLVWSIASFEEIKHRKSASEGDEIANDTLINEVRKVEITINRMEY